MRPSPDLTSERVKSHLQKYRKNREKSRKEFIASYDCALERMQKQALQQQQLVSEQEDTESTAGGSLSCGEPAAQCTYVSLAETTRVSALNNNDSVSRELGSMRSTPVPSVMAGPSSSLGQPIQISTVVADGVLRMPELTTQEKCSHIGLAFRSLVELWQALSYQIKETRIQKQQESDNTYTQVSFACSSQNKENAVAHNQLGEQTQPLTHQCQPSEHGQQRQQRVHISRTPLIQPYVEQAAANAVSMQHAANNDPTIHEVAASIPHAYMMCPQQPSNVAGDAAGGQHPQQSPNHVHMPQHQQHPQLQTDYHPSHMQQHPHPQVKHSSSHTNDIWAATPTPHTERIGVQHSQQIMNHSQGSAYAAPPPEQPVHKHSEQTFLEAQAPSICVPPQEYLQAYPKQTRPPNEIPTILHQSHQPQPMSTGQLPVAPPNIPLPRVATHQQHEQPAKPTRSNQAHAAQSGPVLTLPESHIEKFAENIAPTPSPSTIQEESSSPPTKSRGFNISPVSGSPSGGARTTLQAQEESTMMKKDMCFQMAFQNKIRALKQVELSKYCGNKDHCNMEDVDSNTIRIGAPHHSSLSSQHEEQPEPVSNEPPLSPSGNQLADAFDQGVFWNLEDDDQVFDFLMEH